jgi:enoyl-[acyl-carrier protein] reductase I
MSISSTNRSPYCPLDLNGKKGLVLGVANHRSIAWTVTEQLIKYGADVGISVLDERAAKKSQILLDSQSNGFLCQCDLRNQMQLAQLISQATDQFGQLDFIIHSVAFAHINDLKNPISECSQSGYLDAMEVSAYSLLSMVNACRSLLSPGASIVTLSYLGGEVAIPSYGIMGPVKAALEAEARYLAAELGPQNIRVNVVSAGPLKTLAASAIPGFRQHLKEANQSTPLQRGVTHHEVAHTICFLLSPMSSGITGETIHVDAGRHAVRQF